MFASTRIATTLTLLILLTSTLVTLLSSVMFVINDQRLLRQRFQLAVVEQAQLLALTLAPPLAAKNVPEVNAILSVVGRQVGVAGIVIYAPNQRIVAWSQFNGNTLALLPPQPGMDGSRWYPNYFTHIEPVFWANERIGTLYLGYHRAYLGVNTEEYLALVALIIIISLGLALLLALKMQRIVSQPILEVAEFLAQVSQRQNYSMRLNHQRQDEIGQLIDNLNATLAVIEQQKGRLSQHIHHIESLVNLRTSELRAANTQLAQQAYYDALTELPNRRLLQDRMRQAFRRLRGSEHQVGALFLDLDGFKQINDAHGHNVGDEVLRVVAAKICTVVRLQDTVARLGGDEFFVLLEDLDNPQEVAQVAERVLQILHAPIVIQDLHLHVGVSIGIAFYPQDAQSAEDLIQHADHAMYQAKSAGKGCYVFYQSLTPRLVGASTQPLIDRPPSTANT